MKRRKNTHENSLVPLNVLFRLSLALILICSNHLELREGKEVPPLQMITGWGQAKIERVFEMEVLLIYGIDGVERKKGHQKRICHLQYWIHKTDALDW